MEAAARGRLRCAPRALEEGAVRWRAQLCLELADVLVRGAQASPPRGPSEHLLRLVLARASSLRGGSCARGLRALRLLLLRGRGGGIRPQHCGEAAGRCELAPLKREAKGNEDAAALHCTKQRRGSGGAKSHKGSVWRRRAAAKTLQSQQSAPRRGSPLSEGRTPPMTRPPLAPCLARAALGRRRAAKRGMTPCGEPRRGLRAVRTV